MKVSTNYKGVQAYASSGYATPQADECRFDEVTWN